MFIWVTHNAGDARLNGTHENITTYLLYRDTVLTALTSAPWLSRARATRLFSFNTIRSIRQMTTDEQFSFVFIAKPFIATWSFVASDRIHYC